MGLKVLFIGGTGIISSACSALAVERGLDLYLLNRGSTSTRPVPEGATVLRGDIRDLSSAQSALEGRSFDAVVDWIAFSPEHVEADIELFRGRTGQYIFISSASAYQTPPASLPVTESTPLYNPVWAYSRAKIACEERLMQAYREGFPSVIVRPSHTYDRTLLPMHGGYTVVDRMRRGRPVVVHGDGSSLWTMTHHRDFAKGLVGLLGNPRTLGEAFHITSDEVVTWDAIHRIFATAAGAPEPQLVHVPSDVIAAYDQRWGDSLLGDKTHSMVFDNSKIKRFVPDYQATIPLALGAREVVEWYDADPARRSVNEGVDKLIDEIISAQQRALPAHAA